MFSGFGNDLKHGLPACQREPPPLALFLTPQSLDKRLAAQQRDHEKLQGERQPRELPEAEALFPCS